MSVELRFGELMLRRSLPVIINSFNQFTYLKNLVEKLEEQQFKNIVVLDNASTYQPLLTYYETLKQENRAVIVYYLENKGPHFFHLSGYYKLFGSIPHFYTDPDLSFDILAPDFATELVTLAEKYSIFKVGPALEIPGPQELRDGIYTEYKGQRYSIPEWEAQYWADTVEPGVYYPGHIDTTFHLFYPANYKKGAAIIDGVRVGKAGFVFKHLPWVNSFPIPEEELRFYERSSRHSTLKTSK